jgi:DNA-binding Xre family transcriptional regulator
MSDVRAIRPLAENGDTVLLRRADYEALVREAEDAADAAQIRAAEARVAAGEDEYVPIEVTRRLMAGEVPVRVWREHRGLSARALATRAGISAAYLSQIETGKKPGSFDAMARLARALDVAMEDLEPWRT